MIHAKKIKTHYELLPEEEKLLAELGPLMKEHKERFAGEFYAYIMSHEEMASFFESQEKLDHHKKLIAGWFIRLFNGTYDDTYIRDLSRIGKVHVDIQLDGHFVNSAMTRVRHFITDLITAYVDENRRAAALLAVNKILDINLDVLTSSYRQAELKKYFISARVETGLVNLMERFTHGLNLVLGLALTVVSIEVIALFVHDAINIFNTSDLERTVISALGSLLIIWMMIELLGTEVKHLKGQKIPIKVFIGIVIVAFIRKVLVASLEHSTLTEYGMKVGTLFVLALVFWLVAKADRA
jgi:uncharacterized membrane protein (DUF373 family)